MDGCRIISSDDHVMEPPDLWGERIEPRFRDRAPRVMREEGGGDWWFCDGVRGNTAAAGAQVGRRFEDQDSLTRIETFENVRPGGYIPEEHVKDMALDGIDVSITYPTEGLFLYNVPDSELLSAVFRTYNDWLADFCKPFPNQIKGIAMLNVDDVGGAVRELERCAGLGLVGAMITVSPPAGRSYDRPDYEPLWASAQDLEIPLSLHVSTNRVVRADMVTDETIRAVSMCNSDYPVRTSLAYMIYSGVFERYPKLRVGAIEHELSWVPYFVDRLDYNYTQRVRELAPHRYEEDMLPSDYFHRNVFLSFQEDALGLRLRDVIGVDSLLWGSDYPHIESTFPRSREILERILADCTQEERAKIVGGNAARIYRLG